METVINTENAVRDVMSGWMTTNLPWRERFWQDMDAMSFMRLNPHWHIHEKNGAYAIDDILTDFQFCTDAVLERATGLWSARFPTIGLTLMARRGADGNAELAYTFRREAGCRLNADRAKSLASYWLPSVREYFRLFANDSFKNRFWRFVMNRITLKMTPPQRRICSFIFRLTLLEMVLMVILGIGFRFYFN